MQLLPQPQGRTGIGALTRRYAGEQFAEPVVVVVLLLLALGCVATSVLLT